MNWLRHDSIEGQMTEMKGLRRRRRTRKLLDDLRNRRKNSELNEKAEGRKRWKRQFINPT